MVSGLFKIRFPELGGRIPVVRAGRILFDGVQVCVTKILLDSGAIHSSYISKSLVDMHRDVWDRVIRKVDGKVTLGDNTTTITVDERVTLELELINLQGKSFICAVDFCVWTMPGMDVILGLPDILEGYLDLFVDILEAARKYERDHKSPDRPSRVQLASGLEDRYDVGSPWTKVQDEVAPEEEATETPCSFTGPLYYLTKPHAEVIQEYKSMFDSHVSKE